MGENITRGGPVEKIFPSVTFGTTPANLNAAGVSTGWIYVGDLRSLTIHIVNSIASEAFIIYGSNGSDLTATAILTAPFPNLSAERLPLDATRAPLITAGAPLFQTAGELVGGVSHIFTVLSPAGGPAETDILVQIADVPLKWVRVFKRTHVSATSVVALLEGHLR